MVSQKLPTQGQEPNSKQTTPDGKTIREYGPDGKAVKDTHYGHPHHHPELGIPHHHDWGWDGDIWKPGTAYVIPWDKLSNPNVGDNSGIWGDIIGWLINKGILK